MNNWHKTPNYIYDAYSEMKEAELRLTVWLVRHTYGFHRGNVQATSKEIQEQTGLSKQGLINAQNAVQERGFFVRVSGGYEVNEVDQKVNQIDLKPVSEGQRSRPSKSTKLTSEVNEVDQTGQLSRLSTSSPKESFKESIKEKERETRTHTQKETESETPKHYQNFNAIMGNGDIALSQDDRILKGHLVETIKGIVKDKTALVKIYDLADTLLERKITPAVLVKLFGAGGWWFTSCPLNKTGTPPYVKNIANELDTALATLEVKEATPAVLSPSVVMAHVNGLRGLQNGTYKEAVSRLPDNVRAIMSQALRASKKVGFGTLAEADITAVMVKE